MNETYNDIKSISNNSGDVYLFFVEPWQDPSHDAAITWVSENSGQKRALYRKKGDTKWILTESFRTRMFPERLEWIHTAVADHLEPDTVYEFKVDGTRFTDTWKSCPIKDIVFCLISDYQKKDLQSFGENSHMTKLGKAFQHSGADVDMILWGGDVVSDNGIIDEASSNGWWYMLNNQYKNYRNKDGQQLPMISIIGNHEATNYTSTLPLYIVGQIKDIYSWSYADQDPHRHVNSCSWFSISDEILLIAFDGGWGTPYEEQQEWFFEKLTMCDHYKHVFVIAHNPVFNPGQASRYGSSQQSRYLRNIWWPEMQRYSHKIRAYLCGHDHVLSITKPLRIMMDDYPADPTLSYYDDKFITTTENSGIRQIGAGPSGAYQNSLGASAIVRSSIEDTPFLEVAAGKYFEGRSLAATMPGLISTKGEYEYIGDVDIDTIYNSDSIHHIWKIQATDMKMYTTAYGISGSLLVQKEFDLNNYPDSSP